VFGNNKHGKDKQRGMFMDLMQRVAFWLAVLCTFLMWPQIWALSQVIGDMVFSGSVDDQTLTFMKFALFGILVMIVLSMAQMTWGSSAFVVGLWAVTRLPIF
jgi:hypothetical protein